MVILSQKQKSDEDTNLLQTKSGDLELRRMSNTLGSSWKNTCLLLKIDASVQSYGSVVEEVSVS